MESQSVLLFIILSGELEGLMKQIDFSIAGMDKTFKSKIPDKAEELDKQLSQEFWTGHKTNIKKCLYEETAEHFTEHQLQQVIDFFKSDAGKAYLGWKALIENRSSKYFQANVEMHRQANNIYNALKDQVEGQ